MLRLRAAKGSTEVEQDSHCRCHYCFEVKAKHSHCNYWFQSCTCILDNFLADGNKISGPNKMSILTTLSQQKVFWRKGTLSDVHEGTTRAVGALTPSGCCGGHLLHQLLFSLGPQRLWDPSLRLCSHCYRLSSDPATPVSLAWAIVNAAFLINLPVVGPAPVHPPDCCQNLSNMIWASDFPV